MPVASDAPPVCVLTLGRSGSSLATRVLGLLGLGLGAEEEMHPTDRHNERGYWELREVNALNDEILAAFGGSLWSPPHLPPGWERDPTMEPMRRRAEALADRFRAADRRWAFKDARTVHTLPLWKQALPMMDYVLCVRNPTDVLASLGKLLPDRDPDELSGLWLRANCAALRETAGQRRLILRYEEWFTDPTSTIRRLAEFLTIPIDEGGLACARDAFEPSLRHQQFGTAANGSTDLALEVRALDAVLRKLAEHDDPALETLAYDLDAEHADRVRQRKRTQDLAQRGAEVDQLKVDLAQRQARSDALERELRALRHRHEGLQRDFDVVIGSNSWRLTAPVRALRQGGPRRAGEEVKSLLRRRK